MLRQKWFKTIFPVWCFDPEDKIWSYGALIEKGEHTSIHTYKQF